VNPTGSVNSDCFRIPCSRSLARPPSPLGCHHAHRVTQSVGILAYGPRRPAGKGAKVKGREGGVSVGWRRPTQGRLSRQVAHTAPKLSLLLKESQGSGRPEKDQPPSLQQIVGRRSYVRGGGRTGDVCDTLPCLGPSTAIPELTLRGLTVHSMSSETGDTVGNTNINTHGPPAHRAESGMCGLDAAGQRTPNICVLNCPSIPSPMAAFRDG